MPRPAAPILSPLPPLVSPEQWRAARADLRVKEDATRALDARAAERRRLPRMAFGDD